MIAGMPVAAADGMLVNLADTKENREYFGTTGTGDGSSPFPQLRIVAVTARAGHAILGAAMGTTAQGEQTLLKTLVTEQPGIFARRVTAFDRNFPGHDLILAILIAEGHVIARVKAGITLPFQDTADKGWLPDGSRISWLNAPSGKKEDRLPVRVAEYSALVTGPDGEKVAETCTLITTLLDHEAVPAAAVRDGYTTRWSASETAFGQDKATITGAGNRTSGPVLRSGCPQLVEQEAWAWLASAQLVRASAVASLRSEEAAARGLRRENAEPVLHRRLAPRRPLHGNIAGHRHVIAHGHQRRIRLGRPRAPAHAEHPGPGPALAPRPESPPQIRAQVRVQADRHREIPGHRVRARPTLNPVPAPAQGRRTAPARRGRGPWNRAPDPPRHAGSCHARPHQSTGH
jgi:hypothetical protein